MHEGQTGPDAVRKVSVPPRRHHRREPSAAFVALCIVTAAYVGWVLSMPCFPSADGPVHMYYVHVLRALLTRSSPSYSHYFHVRHLLPPYSLYYYGLLLGSFALPMLLVDRLMVCLYIVSFVFGFRFLARTIGPGGDWTALVATILLLNWPLGMGFVNFCLSLSFSFWAAGLWLQLEGRRAAGKRVIFLILATAIMLTHPVPLLLLLLAAAATLLVRILHTSRNQAGRRLPAACRADVGTLALASLNLLYVKFFTTSHFLQQTAQGPALSYKAEVLRRIAIYAKENALSFVYGRGLDIYFYRFALLLMLAVAVAVSGQQRLRNCRARLWTHGDTFFCLGGALCLGLPFTPSQLNGLYYFADRLVLVVWLAFLLSASGWFPVASRRRSAGGTAKGLSDPGLAVEMTSASRFAAADLAAIVFSGVTTAALLYASNSILRPVANAIANLDGTPSFPSRQLGFVFEDPRPESEAVTRGPSWNPFYWATVHLLRKNDDILANAPWAEETILPVAPSATLPEMRLPALAEPLPTHVQASMLQHPRELQSLLTEVTFFVVNQVHRPTLPSDEPLLRLSDQPKAHWSCKNEGWYRVCHRLGTDGEPLSGSTIDCLQRFGPTSH